MKSRKTDTGIRENKYKKQIQKRIYAVVSLTRNGGSVTLLLLLGNVDRGCIFYEYDVGWTGTEEVIKKEKMPKGYGIT